MEEWMDEPAASTAGLVIQGAVTTGDLGKPRKRVIVLLSRSQALTSACHNAFSMVDQELHSS